MNGTPQAKLVMRLRRTRLDAAQAALAVARDATRQAEQRLEACQADSRAAVAGTGIARETLAEDTDNAEVRLALLDRRRFEEALAAERAVEADRKAAQARFDEDIERARLLRARARHDALETRINDVARAAAILDEELEALDTEHLGRRR
jgi:hypothetical protein